MLDTLSRRVPMPDAHQLTQPSAESWLWHGYLAGGNVTLLTSQWKIGKTTLITGLLGCLEKGEAFLGQPVQAGRALVVSEESPAHWTGRLRTMPLGRNIDLLSRPFPGRPSVAEWNKLISEAVELRQQNELDLLVVDPLASFLPGRCESDAGTLLEMLQPLHRLASEGVAVLLLHHPRKKPSELGSSARGSGALLGFVDIVLELIRFSRLKGDSCRRRLIARSRKPETPETLAFEWNPATGRFLDLIDPAKRQFEDNWALLYRLLEPRIWAATHHDILADWPPDTEPPAPSVLYGWLNRAFEEKKVIREGSGTKATPWRYRIEHDAKWYRDRGELPPLR